MNSGKAGSTLRASRRGRGEPANMTHPAQVARALYDAYVAKDRAEAEALIADDFHFTSPLDNRIDRATYFARCWPNSTDLAAFDLMHLVEAGDRVFVTYEARTAKGRLLRNTELLTTHGGKLVEVEVYFGWDLPHKAVPGGWLKNSAE